MQVIGISSGGIRINHLFTNSIPAKCLQILTNEVIAGKDEVLASSLREEIAPRASLFPRETHASHASDGGTNPAVANQNHLAPAGRGDSWSRFSRKIALLTVSLGRAIMHRRPSPSCCTCAPAMLAKPRF
jgi:hypothetical protein